MALPLLGVPFRRTLQLNLNEGLRRLIDSNFFQTANYFEKDLTKIDVLRDHLFHCDVTEKDLRELISYYLSLKGLAVKFPDDQIEFTWFNTLGHKSAGLTKNSIQYEIFNVLYNIGSMYSLLGIESYQEVGDGLKKACRLFQYAAGCFQRIYDYDLVGDKQLFERNMLLCLVSTMLAQAQEVVWMKALRDTPEKHSMLSKLAIGVASLYEEAASCGNRSAVIRTDWVKHMENKRYYFMAVAYYRSAYQVIDARKYSQGIMDLKFCLSWISKISREANLDQWREEVEKLLKTTERDNDLIYLQPEVNIPSKVVSALMVKAEYFNDIDKVDENIFSSLLPIEIMETTAAFNERIQNYVEKYISKPLEALNKLLIETLSGQGDSFPTPFLSSEPWEIYVQSFDDIEHLQNYVVENFRQTKIMLDSDLDCNEIMIKKYGNNKWKIDSLPLEAENLHEKLKKVETYIMDGENINKKTRELFDSLDQDFIHQRKDIPPSSEPRVTEIENLINERKNYILSTEKKTLKNRLLPKIVDFYKKTGSTDFEALYQEHLKMFKEDLVYVQQQKTKNKELVENFNSNDLPLGKIKRLDPRDLYFEELKYTAQVLSEVKENICSGKNYYQDLITNIDNIKMDVKEFVKRRTAERLSHEENM